jgi:hypothetical protein
MLRFDLMCLSIMRTPIMPELIVNNAVPSLRRKS